MAHIEQRGYSFRLIFRYQGRRYAQPLKTTEQREAEAIAGGVEKTIFRLENGLLEMPDDADLITFLLSDGARAQRPAPAVVRKLRELCEGYLEALDGGAVEGTTLAMKRIHLNHVVKTLGTDFPAGALKMIDLQRHVDRRRRAGDEGPAPESRDDLQGAGHLQGLLELGP
jgi:hypothetical protein